MDTSAPALQLARYQTARAVNYMAPQHPAYPAELTNCAIAKETRAMTITTVEVSAELAGHSAERLRQVQDELNNRPRKCLNWESPATVLARLQSAYS